MKWKTIKNLISISIITLIFVSGVFVFLAEIVFASITDGTIGTTYKYAWGENIGWINFGTTNGNVHVTDSGLSGYALGENVGWINLDNVTNDGAGNLSGYAWSENAGWIKFNPTNDGVVINSSGEFTGSALGENIGWIIFDCDYRVKTDWRPQSARVCTSWTYSDWSNCANSQQTRTIVSSSPAGCSGGSPVLSQSCSSGGGGGLPPGAYSPPTPPSPTPESPKGGFRVLINDDDILTNSRDVSLELIAGSDTKRMAICNNPDFSGPGTGQITFQPPYNWDLCYWQKECPDGEYTVYAKFYTQYGQSSEVVSDKIILDTTAPEIKRIDVKDYYRTDEDVVLSGKTEAKAEIILHWDEKYDLVYADDSGFWIVNLRKLSVGKYSLELTAKDIAGNVSEPITVNLIIKAKEAPSIPEVPEVVPEKPEEIISVPEEAPLVMKGEWQLLPPEPIQEFVLAPLPKEIKILAEKFPELEKTFEEVGIVKITDVEKLKTVELTLPGLTEIKEEIPTEIVFAKTGGELIDFNIVLTLTEKGKPEQRIRTISGKPLQLVVKPEKPVKSIKGYVVFKSKKKELGVKNQELSLDLLLASMVFASPSFAKEYNPIEIEERLVLMEFEYTDPDGDGIYTAEIQAPLIEGEYEIITVMDFEDPELGKKEIRLIAVVDPEGYVYEKDRDKETRIPGAIVSLFWLNPETKQYELWPAKEYQQENPQITNTTGKYSFLVPEGSYYLKVEAPSYLIYDGKPFQVKEGSGVHVNIELKTKYWWLKVVDWKTILLIAVILLLLYNFYRDKIREKLLKRQFK